ncbi:MAG: PAS domain S-box protein, partial [Acidobacteria bacterium]|nr:PAS domain S-box protein [Acidobacteriota bacterium]
AAIDAARTGRPHRQILLFYGDLYLIVSEPARFADEILGTFSVAYLLDDRVARQLANMARCEVNFVAGDRLTASSLPTSARANLSAALARDAASLGRVGDEPVLRRVRDNEYVAERYALATRGGSGTVVLLQDWEPTRRFLNDISRRLIWIGAFVFALALAGSHVFTRAVTNPLRALATVARDVAAGNWTRQVAVRGSAEAVEMAEAFNEMTSRLNHWHNEARQKSERLEEAYKRFYAVTQSANDGIISTDSEGRIIFLNRAAEAMFGYSDREAAGQPLTILLPDRRRERQGNALTAFASGADSPAALGKTVELQGLRRDGREFPVEITIATWRAGHETFLSAFVRDITMRTQLESQLRQAQKMEAGGRLAGGVAHDFNNLLTVIAGYSDLILDSLGSDGSLRAEVEEIRKAGERAASLTRQLLAFSRKQVLQPEVIDLNPVVESTEKMLRRLIGEDVTLVTVAGCPDAWVRADASQLEQIIMNLAVNSRDAMPDGGSLMLETAEVRSDGGTPCANAVLPAGPYVMLVVSDTGCGMDLETQAAAFEPFFTTKEPGKGTGLGLSTVYGIVQQSGGHIARESAPGRGTAVRRVLPRVPAPSSTDEVDTTPEIVAPARETILLVEDEMQVRALSSLLLRRQGYRVLEASDGGEAIVAADGHDGPIDLLLTDVVMPGMSGLDLAARLETSRPQVRTLFMSGYSDRMHGRLENGVDFLQKPFTAHALIKKIRQVIDGGEPVSAAAVRPRE